METQCKVLLIEDNPGDTRLVREHLAKAEAPQFKITHVERVSIQPPIFWTKTRPL